VDCPLTHILSGGILVRTFACPVPEQAHTRLRGARAAPTQPPRLSGQFTVTRWVSVRGAIMVDGQRIQVGLPHTGKTANVTVQTDTYQITVEDGITIAAPRKTSRDIKRHKASDYPPNPGDDGDRRRTGRPPGPHKSLGRCRTSSEANPSHIK
jgi:hypothetical protein